MHGTEPVGSTCLLVDGHTGRWVLVTARHCLSPQPGKPIGDLGLMAYDYKLRHVAQHDISVLAFEGSPHEDADLKRKATPFELASGVGLVPGWRVSAVGFPLAVDMDVLGAKSSADGVLLSGIISWLKRNLDLALADYTGAMPNFSGGAVVLSGGPTGTLVGVHLGAVWHREGEPPTGDDVQPQGDQLAEGAWGERDVMETDCWCEALHVAMLSTGGKKRRTSGSTSTSQGKDRSRLAEAAIQYCVANVPHKGSLSYFVPAHTLHRLVGLALSAPGTAAGGAPAGLGAPGAV
ncbi:hypothetical protein TSOC_012753 [Tetrabaena socialis]|uniref:Peptidase S1 domain-containing protein n=1 Tax=Tetrabaena socialis TaxID=47790 RepID=A0A2J7ZM77_9CHLO|nr:hypothetical protein TSOC_012753 [Tetrabaena socialis]|eukprot:PNH01367.1 hypothetical protein TSOC_012753 [Tetrabaena socialis]